MMSVREYASDVNISVDKILKLCKELGINITSEDDMLDDDGIIMLDNEIANISDTDTEEVVEDIEDVHEEAEYLDSILEENTNKKVQVKKKDKNNPISKGGNKKSDFMKQRKEMYKHKDKLKSNTVELDENVVL